jgi:pimeloyl-ACP methyl ester carboxylesterase
VGGVFGGSMKRPVVLIHGYSAEGVDFEPIANALKGVAAVDGGRLDPLAGIGGADLIDINIGNYVSLNNEITIKDIAEGFDRALRQNEKLNAGQEFDAIVHSTGMLVIRSWLTNYGAAVTSNARLKRLKHLVGLAPATWGSPQAHKGRTWLGALVKGNKKIGPDFLNSGDEVLDGLELGSKFTWDLAEADLLGAAPYYSKGPETPYVTVFIGNTGYDGISSVANDPGTDGTVRWSGCGLNTRKIIVDLTRTPIGEDGKEAPRVSITPWENDRLDIPIIPVEGKCHSSLISDPDPVMVGLVRDFLRVGDEGGETHEAWLKRAKEFGDPAKVKMLTDPGKDAGGLTGDFKTFFGHIFHLAGKAMEGWQQFVVHARDERGDGVTDYLIDVLRLDGKDQDGNDNWVAFEEMYTDVHAYKADPSYRCFHIRLPAAISDGTLPLKLRIHASTGTELMAYQGYSSDDDGMKKMANAEPVEIQLGGLGESGDSLFHPFTTTLVEIVLNREPAPLNATSRIFNFI